MNADQRRSAAILFSEELSAGAIGAEDLDRPAVTHAVRRRPVGPLPVRVLERLAMKGGLRGYERDCVRPFVAARHTVLGSRAPGTPRLLIRVDEFPHVMAFDEPARFGTAAFERFDAIMQGAGVEYMIAALPKLAHRPYDPGATGGRELDEGECEMLRRLHSAGVGIAVHGLDHRTREAGTRHHSELLGLADDQLETRLDAADEVLAGLGIRPRVFVPPFNRFSSSQYGALARRYDVVCGGPESVVEMGFHRTPLWRGDAVYMPAYHPLYGRAGDVRPALELLIERQVALWVPIVLHWGWELDDDFEQLSRLAELAAPHARPWTELIDAAPRRSSGVVR